MYNYHAPGQYAAPPGYGAFPPPAATPPGMAPPPGMSLPPGMAPPGLAPAPGIIPIQGSLPNRPGSIPPVFQPPAGLPANFNPNAPIIRLGTSGPPKSETPGARKESTDGAAGGSRRGLGAGADARGGDSHRGQAREQMAPLVPPSKEEIARTIFVSNITDGVGGDDGLERILRAAGSLRRWTRCTDADNKPCSFGFAEFEDAESLETAVEIFKDVEVPVEKQSPGAQKSEEEAEVKKAKLNIVIDEASIKYAEEWKSRRNEDEAASQFRIDTAKEQLDSVLHSLFNPPVVDASGDTTMQEDGSKPEGASAAEEFVPFKPSAPEDELADIPAEMRETVAAEIAAFRERSNRRDIERAKREEELEAAERQKNLGGSGIDRFAGGANGIPLGPRGGVHGAPSGPKGFQGVQVPKDYQNGVSFVASGTIHREDDDDPASDEEIERRKLQKKEEELNKIFFEQERRWLGRERTRAAAVERQKASDEQEEASLAKNKEAAAKQLKHWNDDVEAARGVEEYYRDRSLWIRNRTAFRKREARADEIDRMAEERERAEEQEKRDQARGLADSFLERQAQELEAKAQAPQGPQRFKMSLGAAAAQKAQAATAPRRTIAEIEGLLEDEEETTATTKRPLIPIQFDTPAQAANMTEEERAQAQRQLAASIPENTEDLWNWDIKWDCVDDHIITEKLEPFIEKKIMDSLGVQDQWLVELVTELLRKRSDPRQIVSELSQPLDEEAEGMVKKLWRLLIFFSESEKRGLPY